jgi:hypothetical protein
MLTHWILSDNFITVWIEAKDNTILSKQTENDITNAILPDTNELDHCISYLINRGYRVVYFQTTRQ